MLVEDSQPGDERMCGDVDSRGECCDFFAEGFELCRGELLALRTGLVLLVYDRDRRERILVRNELPSHMSSATARTLKLAVESQD